MLNFAPSSDIYDPHMKFKTHLFLSLFLFSPIFISAQTDDDNIIITDCSDTYTFTKDENGKIKIKNIKETEFLARKTSEAVQQAVYYGDDISLDKISPKSGAQYTNATTENIFFDDTKVCNLNIVLAHKGKTATAKYERTFNDVRTLARVFLSENYFIKHKTTTFIVPKRYAKFSLRTVNQTPYINLNRSVNEKGDSVFTYTITDAPAFKKEINMPGFARTYPFVLLFGQFDNYHDLYKWMASMADVDCTVPQIDDILTEINKGCKSDTDKIRRTYAWVQSHIRYVANESGAAGYRPDKPSEVIRKQFGDCKGMSLLLRTLLRRQGFDARLVDINTEDLPYNVSDVPSLASSNHVVCALLHGGKTYFIDATANYLSFDFIAQHIQGRQGMMENGYDCQLVTLPVMPESVSIDSLKYQSRITPDGILSSDATGIWSGSLKDWVLYTYNNTDNKNKEALLKRFINDDLNTNTVSEAAWTDDRRESERAVIKGKVESKTAITTSGSNLYVDLNPHNEMFNTPIDTAKRVHDYCISYRCKMVRENVLDVPATAFELTYMPHDTSLSTKQGTFELTWSNNNGKITRREVIIIKNRLIRRADIQAWNNTLKKWKNVCNELITLKKK